MVAIAGGLIGSAIGLTGIALSLFSMVFQGLAMMILGGQNKGSQPPISGVQQVVRSAIEARRIVYGETRASGPLAYAAGTGAANDFLQLVIPLAGHRCFYIGDTFYDDIPADPVDGSNNVVSGPLYVPAGAVPTRVHVEKALGTLTQPANAFLSGADPNWDASHRGLGVAYVYTQLRYGPVVFPSGIPNVSCVIKGRLVYDPRNPGPAIASSSSGTPGVFTTATSHGLNPGDPVWIIGHSAVGSVSFPSLGTKIAKEYEVATTPSGTTFTLLGADGNPLALAAGGSGGTVTKMLWSNNWALCVRDWIASLFGLGADDTTEIAEATFIAAANTSDELVALAQLIDTFTASVGANQLTLAGTVSVGPLATGDQVTLSTTGTLPAPLAAGTTYWAIRTGTDPTLPTTLQLATSLANALAQPPVPINVTTAGSGTHTLTKSFQKTFTALSASRRLQLADDKTYFATGDQVQLSTTGALPTGLSAGATYDWISQGSINVRKGGTATVISGIHTTTTDLFAIYGLLATSLANARAGIAVSFSDAGTGTHSIAKTAHLRYTADGVIKRDQKRIDILEALLTGGAGALIYTAGQYNLFAAVAGTATLTLDESWLADGDIILQTAIERAQLFNAVRGTYVDPGRSWQDADMPPLVNPAYEAQDGGERIYKDLTFPFSQDGTRCQRLGNITLQKSRAGQTFSMRCNFRALQLAGWDVVTVSLAKFGISGPFRVLGWKPSLDPTANFGVDLVLQEENSAAYSWTQGQAQTINISADVNIPLPTVAQPPTGLALASGTAQLFIAGDGTVHARILATWTAPSDVFVTEAGQIEVQFKKSTDGNWSPSMFVGGSVTQAYLSPVLDGVDYDVRLRSVNPLRATSDWVQQLGYAVVGKTAPPTVPPSLVVTQNGDSLNFAAGAVPDLDIDTFELRYGSASQSWDQKAFIGAPKAQRSAGGSSAAFTSAAVPVGTWTFACKSRDTSGNYSTTAVEVPFTVTGSGSALVYSQTQAPDWTGLDTSIGPSSTGWLRHCLGYLVPESTKAANLHTNAELFEQFVPYPVASCIYEAPAIDIGLDDTVRIYASPFTILPGGGVVGTPTAAMELDTWLSAGSDTGVFTASDGAQVTARHIRARAKHVPGSTPGYLVDFAPAADKQQLVQNGGPLTVAAGGTVIAFPKPYHAAPSVACLPTGANVGWVDNVTTTQAKLHVGPDTGHDNGGAGVGWTATGA